MTRPDPRQDRAVILVVDDDGRNRSIVSGYLGSEHTVREASSGAAALDVLAREPVDLVLLDLMMPGVSGIELCPQIKAARGGYLPVIMLTALSDQQHRNAALEAGADDFITKPADKRELRLRVNAFLRLRRHELTIARQLAELHALAALKDDLVSLLVHDLRNPLTAVLALLEILESDIRDPVLAEDCRNALSASTKMREALEDLLQVRLLEEGQLRPNRTFHDLVAVAREAVATVDGAAKERGVRLSVAAPGGAFAFGFDRNLVRRSLENLIVNAVTYSRRDGVVEIVVSNPSPGEAVVEVCDRGPGIPSAFKARIFDKFGTVEARKSNERRGFGLGLYLVRLVAEAHGGAAVAADRDGGGTVFRLALAADA